jgi:hypothetical protein
MSNKAQIATEKKAHPILFSTPMVKAIKEGRKTMTRRVIKNARAQASTILSQISDNFYFSNDRETYLELNCPYGKVGDLLAVKETFYAYGKYRYTGKLTEKGKKEVEFWDCTLDANGAYRYAADETLPKPENRFEFAWHKRPAIFMPLVAVRLRPPITNIRVERLQEISVADIYAEGLKPDVIDSTGEWEKEFTQKFASIWDKINGKREGCSWSDNPFVWIIEFKKV